MIISMFTRRRYFREHGGKRKRRNSWSSPYAFPRRKARVRCNAFRFYSAAHALTSKLKTWNVTPYISILSFTNPRLFLLFFPSHGLLDLLGASCLRTKERTQPWKANRKWSRREVSANETFSRNTSPRPPVILTRAGAITILGHWDSPDFVKENLAALITTSHGTWAGVMIFRLPVNFVAMNIVLLISPSSENASNLYWMSAKVRARLQRMSLTEFPSKRISRENWSPVRNWPFFTE